MIDFPEDLAIRVRDVSKTYRIGAINRRTFRDELIYRWERLRRHDPRESLGKFDSAEMADEGLFNALDHVSFDVRKGETVGLIGRNGAGKSTMLKLLARITTPTTGEAWVRGRIGSMLEVGTGFHPELTGRENIYLNGAILGMSRQEIDAKFDEIVEFSEIGNFLETPVKRYSSGMYVKLAFSIASSLDTDILLLDEVLAVGDAAFRKKSLARMTEIAKSGRTIIFVSHAMANIREICSKCIWFDQGALKMIGPTKGVADAYENSLSEKIELVSHADLSNLPRKVRMSAKIRFSGISIFGEVNQDGHLRCGSRIVVRLHLTVRCLVKKCELAISIRDPNGVLLCSFPTRLTHNSFWLSAGHHTADLELPKTPLPLGDYAIAISAKAEGEKVDHLECATLLHIDDGDFFGRGKCVSGGFAGSIVLCEHSWAIDNS